MKGGGLAGGTGASASTPYDFEGGGEANIKGSVSVNGSGYFKKDVYLNEDIRPLSSGKGTIGKSSTYFDRSYINSGYFESGILVAHPSVPSTASSPGEQGQIVWDASYLYICVADGTWKRAAISTW